MNAYQTTKLDIEKMILSAKRESVFIEPVFHDSEIERLFINDFKKYIDHRNCIIVPQYRVKTEIGIFKVDYVVERSSGVKYGFECDGREFHDVDKDRFRDSAILATGEVAQIFRMDGTGIVKHLDQCLYYLSRWIPEIFAERSLVNLDMLTRHSRNENFSPNLDILKNFPEFENERSWKISREKLIGKNGEKTEFGITADFLYEHGITNLSEFMELIDSGKGWFFKYNHHLQMERRKQKP